MILCKTFEWFALGMLIGAIAIGILMSALQAKPEQLSFTSHTLLTDTFRDIKYDRVIRVEYETRKGPWWSWQAFEEDVNFKIITKIEE